MYQKNTLSYTSLLTIFDWNSTYVEEHILYRLTTIIADPEYLTVFLFIYLAWQVKSLTSLGICLVISEPLIFV